MSLGEVGRNIARLDASLNALREQNVPMAVWDAEHRALTDRLHQHEKAAEEVYRRIERELEELRIGHERDLEALRRSVNKRFETQAISRKSTREFTWSRGIGVAMVLATIIGLIVAAFAASRGVH